jgi:hypothetical protein
MAPAAGQEFAASVLRSFSSGGLLHLTIDALVELHAQYWSIGVADVRPF